MLLKRPLSPEAFENQLVLSSGEHTLSDVFAMAGVEFCADCGAAMMDRHDIRDNHTIENYLECPGCGRIEI